MPDGIQRRGGPTNDLLTLPNAITVARRCAVPLAIRPLFISEIKTALQLALIALVLLLAGFHRAAPLMEQTLILAVAVSTLSSGAAYVRRAVRAG